MEARKIMSSIAASREVITRQVEQRGLDVPARPTGSQDGPDGVLDACLRYDLVRAADDLASLGRIESNTRRELAARADRSREGGGDPPNKP